MGNSTTYVELWLACMSINVVPAFINFSLTNKGLEHCIAVSDAKAVLFEAEYEPSLQAIQSSLPQVQQWIRLNLDGVTYDKERAASLEAAKAEVGNEELQPLPSVLHVDQALLDQQSTKELDDSYRKDVTQTSPAVLIYTSGTTGLPKAAVCAHGRIGVALVTWPMINSFGPHDRIYTCMPLYHSSAAFLCIGASWYAGATVIIGRKFSASKFWEEARTNRATVVQYIGEICRYLLAVPPSPQDKQHSVRMAYGNGMRPDVWNKFRDRFGVRVISEFYASSEGNGALLSYNTGEFGSGSVGRMGSVARTLKPHFKIAKVDPITEEIYRDPQTGLCVECGPDEQGEYVSKIMGSPSAQFAGYAGNQKATESKVLKDVFKKGDAWFRSGDLMRVDRDGFFWFGDRLGDTFRWRSENVSTAEVAAALGEVLHEANVYGVLVPNHDGRAGCAAIPRPVFESADLKQLAHHAKKRLPKYAVPLFLRVVPEMEKTGTVKQLKVALRNEGIDPKLVKDDPLYWLPPKGDAYVPFGPEEYKKIEAGLVKL